MPVESPFRMSKVPNIGTEILRLEDDARAFEAMGVTIPGEFYAGSRGRVLLVHLALGSDQIVGLPAKVQNAWDEGLDLAQRLDEIVPLLIRARIHATDMRPEHDLTDGQTICLVCDPTGAHVRRVWEAWRDVAEGGLDARELTPLRTRGGRWTRLAALHVAIRALPLDQELAEYRAPKPMVTEQYFDKNGGYKGGVRQVKVDPEDSGYTTPTPEENITPAERNRQQQSRAFWQKGFEVTSKKPTHAEQFERDVPKNDDVPKDADKDK